MTLRLIFLYLPSARRLTLNNIAFRLTSLNATNTLKWSLSQFHTPLCLVTFETTSRAGGASQPHGAAPPGYSETRNKRFSVSVA